MIDSIPIQRVRRRLQRRFGKVVRRRREATKLSQEAFADHIGMHRTQYSFVERGKRDLRLSTLERVARGLEQPLWLILREAEEATLEGSGLPVDQNPHPDRDPP